MEKLQNQKPTTKSKKVKSKLKTNKTKCIMTKRSLSLTQFRARPQKRPKAAHRNQIGERKRNLIVKHLVYREIIEEATIGKNINYQLDGIPCILSYKLVKFSWAFTFVSKVPLNGK